MIWHDLTTCWKGPINFEAQRHNWMVSGPNLINIMFSPCFFSACGFSWFGLSWTHGNSTNYIMDNGIELAVANMMLISNHLDILIIHVLLFEGGWHHQTNPFPDSLALTTARSSAAGSINLRNFAQSMACWSSESECFTLMTEKKQRTLCIDWFGPSFQV